MARGKVTKENISGLQKSKEGEGDEPKEGEGHGTRFFTNFIGQAQEVGPRRLSSGTINWTKKVLRIRYEGGGDFGDFSPSFVGVGQEEVEERVEVVAHVIVGVSVFTHLEGTRGDGEL